MNYISIAINDEVIDTDGLLINQPNTSCQNQDKFETNVVKITR